MKKLATIAVAAVVLSSLAACGMKPEDNYQKMRANLVARNFDAVDAYLDKIKTKTYSEKNRLLFYMDKGMVQHLAKKYKDSNKHLEQAKQTAQDLWTESVGANAASWIGNDNALPYQGEDFEKVLIHFIAALNYIGLGDYSGARVEARQISGKLELYTSKYEQRDNIYKDDAFARWLSGKLAESGAKEDTQALNDAWIDFKKSVDVYLTDYAERYKITVPPFVLADALRAAEGLGRDFESEYNELRAKFPTVPFKTRAETKDQGEVVFIHLWGEAPYKIDEYWDASANNDPIRVAFPRFVAKSNVIIGSRISVAGASDDAELGEPVTAIAIQNLDDHSARIKAKAIARAVAKYIASKAAQKAGENAGGTGGALMQLAGAAFQVASYASEEADKRSWITLPAGVSVASAFAAPGEQQLEVELLAAGGRVVERTTLPVTVKPGEVTFVSYRSFK
jgi:hypothetical protein